MLYFFSPKLMLPLVKRPALGAPFDIYIGKTHPSFETADIIEILEDVAHEAADDIKKVLSLKSRMWSA